MHSFIQHPKGRVASKQLVETLIARETIPRHYFLCRAPRFQLFLGLLARARPPLLRTCYCARRGILFQLAGSSAIWIILSRKERFLISNSPNVRCFCCTGRLARYLPRNASASAPRHFVNVPFPRRKVREATPWFCHPISVFQVKVRECPHSGSNFH